MIFFVNLDWKSKLSQKWCSKECRGKKPFLFAQKTNGCIECISHTSSGGSNGKYTLVSANKQEISMHRYVFEKANRKIPEGKVIRHTCDNPKCVNINHLELGTHKENMEDMVNRGRSLVGEKNPASKLTEELVKKIKNDKTVSSYKLSKILNLSPGTIEAIRNGKTWKHVV